MTTPSRPKGPTPDTETLELIRLLAARLARRIAYEKHGDDCSNCQADKELVRMAQETLASYAKEPT